VTLASRILASQAVSLDTLFTEMARRSDASRCRALTRSGREFVQFDLDSPSSLTIRSRYRREPLVFEWLCRRGGLYLRGRRNDIH
jgi:hypothetical protein